MKKFPCAYFVSHNGLGDNITNIGAVHFLLQYYDTIYFICKDIYEENIKHLFLECSVVPVPVDANNEYNETKSIFDNVTCDLFVSGGMHKSYLHKRITHPELLSHKQNDKNYMVHFEHIRSFYYDIGLDLSIYYEYFNIKSTPNSIAYYEKIKKYKIIFVHSKSSTGEIHYNNVYETYNNNPDYIIICANKNMYEPNHKLYAIADTYVNIYVAWYIDIIKQANLIYIINSCFSCIVYPLMMTNQISEDIVTITMRN